MYVASDLPLQAIYKCGGLMAGSPLSLEHARTLATYMRNRCDVDWLERVTGKKCAVPAMLFDETQMTKEYRRRSRQKMYHVNVG